jgi:hypothetical protein
VRMDTLARPRRAEAVHVHVDKLTQARHQKLDVNSRPAVHLGRPLPS